MRSSESNKQEFNLDAINEFLDKYKIDHKIYDNLINFINNNNSYTNQILDEISRKLEEKYNVELDPSVERVDVDLDDPVGNTKDQEIKAQEIFKQVVEGVKQKIIKIKREQLKDALSKLQSACVKKSNSNNSLVMPAFGVLNAIRFEQTSIPEKDLTLVINFAKETTKLLGNPTKTNRYSKILNDINKEYKAASEAGRWGKILSTGAIVLGAALFVTSAVLLIMSGGISAPISAFGMKISADLMMAGAATGVALGAGAGIYSYSKYKKSRNDTTSVLTKIRESAPSAESKQKEQKNESKEEVKEESPKPSSFEDKLVDGPRKGPGSH